MSSKPDPTIGREPLGPNFQAIEAAEAGCRPLPVTAPSAAALAEARADAYHDCRRQARPPAWSASANRSQSSTEAPLATAAADAEWLSPCQQAYEEEICCLAAQRPGRESLSGHACGRDGQLHAARQFTPPIFTMPPVGCTAVSGEGRHGCNRPLPPHAKAIQRQNRRDMCASDDGL